MTVDPAILISLSVAVATLVFVLIPSAWYSSRYTDTRTVWVPRTNAWNETVSDPHYEYKAKPGHEKGVRRCELIVKYAILLVALSLSIAFSLLIYARIH